MVNIDTGVIHRFIDEVGDTTFFGKDKIPLELGKNGVSKCFGIGIVNIDRRLDRVRDEINQMIKDVERDFGGDHPKASEAFAWAFDNGTEPQYVAVLSIPPIDTPSDAVRAAIKSGAFK